MTIHKRKRKPLGDNPKKPHNVRREAEKMATDAVCWGTWRRRSLPWPSSPYSIFSCSGGGWSTRMPQEMSGMGSASSRDTHNTDCSFPAGGRNPTFCQGERVCHGGPGCLPALPPLPTVGGGQLSQCWTFILPEGTARIPVVGWYAPGYLRIPLPPQRLGSAVSLCRSA